MVLTWGVKRELEGVEAPELGFDMAASILDYCSEMQNRVLELSFEAEGILGVAFLKGGQDS